MIDFLINIGIPKQYTGDVWLLVVFLVISLVLLVLIKKRNLDSLLFSIYVAYVISLASFFLPDDVNFQAVYFFGVTAIVFWLMKKIFGINFHGNKIFIWLQTLAITFSVIGLFFSLALTWISPKDLGDFFTPFSQKIFVSETAKFFWAILPFLLLVLVKRRRY